MTDLTDRMRLYVTALLESDHVPAVTAGALVRRGLATVETWERIPVEHCGRGGLVHARLTDAGREIAVSMMIDEHARRLAAGQRSERIPRILARHGLTQSDISDRLRVPA